ncbi:hypothetical protein H351_30940 (plasmid) [Rhodococcus erythropolis R138]|uniref:nuclear transport factor 2 family protein n=1 Tax=Rhodococcus erythropolis TaxID=1833 RepID=UPI0004926177|nr:nuclear transport factor 2 family protein [Rhodococcus erythropolis]ALU73460.1 hypothetical protein H351_30940 [Rhodococcus erythropolis R138]
MTTTSHTTDAEIRASIDEAENAWLTALTEGEQAMRSLMLDDSHVVHGPIGKIDGPDSFVAFASQRRRTVFARAEDTTVIVRGDVAIVTCLQEMHVVFTEDLPPFPIQEAVSRVWKYTVDGWRLAHMHQSKRQPPA